MLSHLYLLKTVTLAILIFSSNTFIPTFDGFLEAAVPVDRIVMDEYSYSVIKARDYLLDMLTVLGVKSSNPRGYRSPE